MCGRFSLSLSASDVKMLFDIDICEEAVQSYLKFWNIAPGMETPAFFSYEDCNLSLAMMKWGIPKNVFSPSLKAGITINTRSENFTEKPYYQKFLNARCIIPASGYYEWMKQGKKSIPYYIRNSDSSCLFFAGIMQSFSNRNYSILTAEADISIRHIHHRMPLMLNMDDSLVWLKEKNLNPSFITESALAKNLNLEYYSVSMLVNSTANNSGKCIEPTFYNEQPDLF